MPDSEGRLSENEKALIESWLRERWKSGRLDCPVSGHRDWVIADHLVQMFIHQKGVGLRIGGPVYPHAVVICNGCGYTLFFNAVMMGLAPPSSQQASPTGQESSAGEKSDVGK